MPFRYALGLVTAGINFPFGYTLATWAAATLSTEQFGTPHLAEVLAFVAGGCSGYFTSVLLSVRYLQPLTPLQTRRTTLPNMAALVVALGVSLIVPMVPSKPVGFLLVGFTSTLGYMLSVAVLLWLGERSSTWPTGASKPVSPGAGADRLV